MAIFDAITAQLQKRLPFVAYRKPGEVKLCTIFQQDDQLHTLGSYLETGFIFAPFDSTQHTIIIPSSTVQTSYIQTYDFKEDTKVYSDGATYEEKENYLNILKKGIAEIQKGHFKKVVLSRSISLATTARPMALFQKLLQFYANAFCYLWYHPKVGLWVGATPENFVTIKNRKLTTMALAGTQKFNGNLNPPWGDKELEEQQFVTNYILETLSEKVSGLKRSAVQTLRAGNLLHLRTEITGNIDYQNLGEIIDVLHPTPAVCGVPKDTTLAFIKANESYDRRFYTGYLGELNIPHYQQRNSNRKNQENQAYRSVNKKTTLYVNLRCMQIDDDIAHLYVGGGITKNSNLEAEWNETVAKTATMLRILE